MKDKLAQTLRDRPVPPAWKKHVHLEWHQGFTWKQRLQILFGYAIRIEVELLMLHDPGRMSQKLTLATTPNQDPKEEVRQ